MEQTTDPKRIFYLIDAYFACAWYRCHVPGMELKRKGHHVVMDTRLAPSGVGDYDVLVFQHPFTSVEMESIRTAKELGKTVVYELDDDLWNLHPTNPAYKTWTKPSIVAATEHCIRIADAVTTTTPPLARQLRRFNKNVHVIPNMLPGEFWPIDELQPQRGDRVTVGWAGSIQRWGDLHVVEHAVLQLLEDHEHMEFAIATDDVRLPPHPRVRRLDSVKIEEYPHLLAQFDVGLAPLMDTRFNQAKSDLKYVEYSMVGVPVVASDVEPYARTIRHGQNGFLAKNEKDWLRLVGRLVEKPELRAEMGLAGQAYARTRLVADNIWMWERAYGLDQEQVVAK